MCGALIGGIIGGYIENSLFSYLIGMFTGGVFAYISYEMDVVIESVKKVVTGDIDIEKMKLRGMVFLQVFLFAMVICSILLFICVIVPAFLSGPIEDLVDIELIQIYLMSQCVGLIISVFIAMMFTYASWENPRRLVENDFFNQTSPFIIKNRLMCILINPIALPFTFAWLVLYGIGMFAYNLPKMIRYLDLAKKIKQVFILIHSECRTICFVDAALGTGVGLYFGSPILGAVIGGLLGLVNYYVVSIKILKIKPA